jgi:glycosyltransferase involved in cell wall biosynthesis
MIKVAHVINTLAVGGAETMLVKFLTNSDRSVFAHRVYTLMSPAGPLSDIVRNLGVPIRELGITRGLPNPLRVLQLARMLRQDPPNLVQTWLYHSDVVGSLGTMMSRTRVPVVWNIRNGTLDDADTRRRTHWVVKACARASTWLPSAVICCSHAALRIHGGFGYDTSKFQVIPNGFNLDAFRPNPDARRAIRHALAIPGGATVVGLVARFDPQKDFRTFVDAARRLHASMPHVHFVMCGRGVTWTNAQLAAWVETAGIKPVCRLLGERKDIADVYAAFDVASSASSYGEAFPNTIGEAMACGIPCVVTDVGESALIVGETGRVVPPGDPGALSKGWAALLGLDDETLRALGVRARERVSQNFAIGPVTRAYEDVYRRVLASKQRSAVALEDARGIPPPVSGPSKTSPNGMLR